jgi:hypothetical protein
MTRYKSCFCFTCNKSYHYLGIARHRAMHRDKKEDCEIQYSNGEIYLHIFSKGNNKDIARESEGVMNEKEIKLDYIHFVCPVCHTANTESWLQVNYDVQCWKCGAEFDVIVKMERSDKGRDELLKKVQSPFRDWEE